MNVCKIWIQILFFFYQHAFEKYQPFCSDVIVLIIDFFV